ncbi:protein kinase [Bermanella sp. R86510]|uniref:protein kinase domain-containing protein n=1 Tax=unclassified Bermanella TaxID=2627862 RepID=UPI0037CB55DD
MNKRLILDIGQYSDAGNKAVNQDFHGTLTPTEPQLSSKGIAIAIADGISSSAVSQIASETAISGFLTDYYCTSDAWSVKKSALKVLQATNAWLHSQTRNSPYRFHKDKGYICTFSALIIKGQQAHIFHTGDSRIYRMTDIEQECLTTDHRHYVDAENSYLTKALGVHASLDLDYDTCNVSIDDYFILATDGVYEFVSSGEIHETIKNHSHDLNKAAKIIVDKALLQGSNDNLTIQLIKIKDLPEHKIREFKQNIEQLSTPPILHTRDMFDGYKILRDLHIGSRSHVYLALDQTNNKRVVLKVPSTEQKENSAYLESFLMESWVAKRLNNAHIVKAFQQQYTPRYIYTCMEYIEGCTLKQWMYDHPKPTLEQVRDIISQVGTGLRALHRQEMVHQDLRPNNIMIDQYGVVKIIDLGTVKVAGISEISDINHGLMGTMAYTAPEYFLGELGTTRSDIYSLGVITYEMLSGHLPYGNKVHKATTLRSQRALTYRSMHNDHSVVSPWIDDAIAKALHPDPVKRYNEVTEFIFDLNQPSEHYKRKHKPPLIDKDPILFWQLVALLLTGVIIAQWLN